MPYPTTRTTQIPLKYLTTNHPPPRKPTSISLAYTPTSIWRNRSTFLRGRPAIQAFLTSKWEKERSYRLRKELFAFTDNKIAVQFW